MFQVNLRTHYLNRQLLIEWRALLLPGPPRPHRQQLTTVGWKLKSGEATRLPTSHPDANARATRHHHESALSVLQV